MINIDFTDMDNLRTLENIFQQLNEENRAHLLLSASALLQMQTIYNNKTEAEKAQETAQNERRERLKERRRYIYRGADSSSIPVMVSRAPGSVPVDDHETVKFKKRITH